MRIKNIFIVLVLISLNLVIVQLALAQENNVEGNFERAIKGGETAITETFGGGEKIDLTGGGTGDPFIYGLFKVINSLLTFTGVIFFLILIYGGYLWMFARGNEDQVLKAKKITKEVILGILIIILARVFVEFILSQFGQSLPN